MTGLALVDYTMRGLLDEDGRPVAEVASPLYDPENTELVACPYHDAREGKPMNASALRQLTREVWPTVRQAARAFAGESPTLHDALRSVVAGLVAPAVHGTETPVPRLLSVWFKTSLGFSQVLVTLALADDGMGDVPLTGIGDRDAFCEALDAQEWLIGATQVCAGPMRMIGDLFATLAGEGPVPERPPAVAGLGPPEIWVDPAMTALGLSVAHACLLSQAVRDGHTLEGRDAAWVSGNTPSWLRAVFAVPNRPPEHAFRLYRSGGGPDAVRAYVAGGPDTPRALADRLAACL